MMLRRLMACALATSAGWCVSLVGPREVCGAETEANRHPSQIAFTTGSLLHTFEGFGAQIWGYYSNPTAQQMVLDELNIKYVRIENYTESATWSQMASTRFMTDALGIQWVFMIWSAPGEFTDSQNRLRDDKIDDFADWWANTMVANLNANGLRPEYIELMNEPDSGGQWSTGITGTQYNMLIDYTRQALDAAGYANVGIVGPGLSSMSWSDPTAYLGSITTANAAKLAAWSTHTWTDDYYGSCGAEGGPCIEYYWPDFAGPADARNPNIPKFATEYATKQNVFHGVVYPEPDSHGGYNATNSMPYAVRVFENTLALLNCGVNVPLIWQAIDEPTEVYNKNKAWGLVDVSGNPKPVYGALKTLCPKIPVGASVLEPMVQHDTIYSAALVKDGRLVVGMANGSTAPQSATLRVAGALCLDILEAEAFVIDHEGDPATEDPDTGQVVYPALAVNADVSIDVTLPADSTLTIVCEMVTEPGDFDGDGGVNLGDYVQMNACLLGPVVPLGTACRCKDLDANGLVDLADFAIFQELFDGIQAR